MQTDNNPLTYLFTTPNIDAKYAGIDGWPLSPILTTIEYQHGRNNAATDALSRVNESLNTHEVKAILDETTIGCPNWAELTVLVSR